MQAFLQCAQRFASILMCALPVYAVADAPKIVHIGYQKSSEARTHYHSLLPITPAVVAEQQEVADTFARLGIIPKPIRVSDDVYHGPVPGL